MHTMHNNCTASCAATNEQGQGFQQSAQLTHIFYKYFYRKKMAAALSVRPQIRTLKESYEKCCAMCANLKIARHY